LFLAGEAALTGLVIAGIHSQMRLQERIDGAPSGPRRRSYREPKARLEALTWTGAALAGALYVWNVADGWTASSERLPLLGVGLEQGAVRQIRLAPAFGPRSGGAALTIALR